MDKPLAYLNAKLLKKAATFQEECVGPKKNEICLTCVNNNFSLERNHHFCYQVQGQLISLDLTGVILWSNDPNQFHCERIYMDDDLRKNKMPPKLTKFYWKVYQQELADQRYGKYLGTRELGNWVRFLE